MARLVLHIGTHNTAAAALQDCFSAHAGLLARHGLICPQPGRGTSHDGLTAVWNPAMKPHEPPEGTAAALRRMVQDHGNSDATVFLSGAEFSRAGQTGRPGGRVDFRAFRALAAGFQAVEVVCVLRDQWQFVQATYLKASRRHVTRSPDQILDGLLHHHMALGLWTDYDRLYRHLLTAFAPQEITLLDHQACTAHPGGLAGAMLAHLGLGGVTLGAEAAAAPGRGPQMPPLAQLAAHQVAAPHATPRWMAEATRGAFAAQYGQDRDSTIWTRAQLASLRGYGDAANARLAASRPGFALSPAIPAADMVHPEDLGGDFWRRSNRWLFAGTQGRSWS